MDARTIRTNLLNLNTLKLTKSTGILLLFMAVPFFTFAQDWHVGAFLGISNYSGDLVQQRVDMKYTRPSLGLLVRRDINRYLTIREPLPGALLPARTAPIAPSRCRPGTSVSAAMCLKVV